MKTLLTLSAILSCLCMQAQHTGWHSIGGNERRNGYADVYGPVTDSVLWEVTSSGGLGTPLYIENNYLVVMRFQSLTYAPVECYNLTTGDLLWTMDVTGNTGRSVPVGLRDGRLYVMAYTDSMDDALFALDVTDGSTLWESNVTAGAYITESGSFDAEGNFYIFGFFKTYKINPATGEMIWETDTTPMASGSGEMALNLDNNTGYVLEQNFGMSYVWAIDLETGERLYSELVPELTPGGNVAQSPLMVGLDGVVYVHLTEDNIAAVSDSGSELTLLWQTAITGNSSFSTMCMGADGSIYAPSDGKIIRLNPSNGQVLNTSLPLTTTGFFSPRISATANDMIYATSGVNGLYAFDLSLNLIWSDDLINTNTSGVAIAPDGLAAACGGNVIRVYVPTTSMDVREPKVAAVRVYPNPTTSFAIVEARSASLGKSYRLTDALGREISGGKLSSRTVLDFEALSNGVYYLRIEGLQEVTPILRQ
ncbi:MAG: PQQ-binding-like beta-propeller repeat protein [Flavobacteriales bacterium]